MLKSILVILTGLFSPLLLAQSANDSLSQAQQAFNDKRYDQANQLATQAFQQSVENNEQGQALTLLGLSLYAQGSWYASAQALQGALAQDSNQPQAKETLSLVLKKLPKSLVRTLDSDKVGDRFEGSVSDWDEAQLDWETKDTLSEQASKPLYKMPSSTEPRQTVHITTSNLHQNAQDQRQDWVLAGEMRDKQKDTQQFYQRLFSLEAGFAVVQDKAQPIEGVNPW